MMLGRHEMVSLLLYAATSERNTAAGARSVDDSISPLEIHPRHLKDLLSTETRFGAMVKPHDTLQGRIPLLHCAGAGRVEIVCREDCTVRNKSLIVVLFIAGFFGYSHFTGGFPGGQAEWVRVPFGDVNCLKIPDDVTDEQGKLSSQIISY